MTTLIERPIPMASLSPAPGSELSPPWRGSVAERALIR